MLLKNRIILSFILCLFASGAGAQDTSFKSKHAAIYFPYPMYHEKWRTSLGLTFFTTPEDITEEVRVRVPCGDFHVLRRLSNHWSIDNRIAFQFLQNHLSTGIRWAKPLGSKVYFNAGADVGYWFGFLTLSGFNSSASGWLAYPNMSMGWRVKKNLLVTVKAQVSVNLHYKAANGESKFNSDDIYYNGETFTLAVEQPFYNKRHLTLAFSAINNYFYWQTWSLFYKTNRKVFYPQITIGLIL